MNLFRSEQHADRWCESWNLPKGAVLPLDTCWKLASIWYGEDRRDPNWRRRTAGEAKDIFDSLGLTSEYWRLT